MILMPDGTMYTAPAYTQLPEHDDGAGRPITLTENGVTRWEPITPPKETQ